MFDPTYPSILDYRFQKFDWQDFYQNVEKDIPMDMPEARGKEVGIHSFVDASHTADKVTRRSQTGDLIFMNKAPITFHSKKQNSLEMSTFGKYTAMKQAVELIKYFR